MQTSTTGYTDAKQQQIIYDEYIKTKVLGEKQGQRI